jgi:undecaprenyl-diphosphatase
MDHLVAEMLNQIIGQVVALDLFLVFVQESYLVKGLPATCVLVMLLASRAEGAAQRRLDVYATIILVFAAIFMGRVMQMTMPFSTRPLYAEGLDLARAVGLGANALQDDSSFPSDHALMYLTLAASVLMFHRAAGLALMVHALVIISLPRLVLGFHWASDILAGAVIGGVVAVLLQRPLSRWLARGSLPRIEATHPALFHAALFAILCETATMYSGTRKLMSAASEFVRLAL